MEERPRRDQLLGMVANAAEYPNRLLRARCLTNLFMENMRPIDERWKPIDRPCTEAELFDVYGGEGRFWEDALKDAEIPLADFTFHLATHLVHEKTPASIEPPRDRDKFKAEIVAALEYCPQARGVTLGGILTEPAVRWLQQYRDHLLPGSLGRCVGPAAAPSTIEHEPAAHGRPSEGMPETSAPSKAAPTATRKRGTDVQIDAAIQSYLTAAESGNPNVNRACNYVLGQFPDAGRDRVREVYRQKTGRAGKVGRPRKIAG
jgi:hypothetical protein